jgi:L-threonylcarbamoyladenylate synthase
MASLWRIKEASASIQAGDVIACPAEAVWGLSCDPWNFSAVAFLCEMKQRALSKGVIVASGDAAHFAPLLDALDEAERDRVLSSWPGPVTWLLPNRGYFPSWVTGESNEVAIRVTSARALSSLCRELDGPSGHNQCQLGGRATGEAPFPGEAILWCANVGCAR